MKSKLHLFTLFLAFAALSVGCAADDADFKGMEDSSGIDPNSKGYLSLDNMSLVVETYDNTYDDDGKDGLDGLVATTRVDDQDIDVVDPFADYIVKISNTATEVVGDIYTGTYGEVVAKSTFTLPAGRYLVEVMSCESEDIALSGWECPEYYGSKQCVVGNEEITKVGDVICTLANVKVSVDMSIDLKDQFKSENLESTDLPLQVSLLTNDAKLNFAPLDPTGEYGYFSAPADSRIVVRLTGMYMTGLDDNNEPIYFAINDGDWEDVVTGVKAGQYRSISVKIEYNDEGGLGFRVETTTWSYDDPIEVSVTATKFLSTILAEDVIADPEDVANAPKITLANGQSVDDAYIIKGSMIDIDTKTYAPTYKAYIAPQGDDTTVKSINITLSSNSSGLMSALAAVGFDGDNSINVYQDGASTLSLLSNYISIRNSDTSSEVVVAMTYEGALGLSQYTGEHEVEVDIIDSKNRSISTVLKIESVNEVLPVIEWLGDYDFNKTYNVYTEKEITASQSTDNPLSNPDIVIGMTSSATEGISKLILTIDSSVLTEELLTDESIGLATELDIINAEEPMKSMIQGLLWPNSEEEVIVAGLQYLEIDITGFLDILAGTGEGYTNFIITMGDSNGDVTRTVSLIREE